MAIGIGADYAVYFIFRVREEFQRTGDLRGRRRRR
jgi:predicted RND superfamily exporter protein